MSARSTRERARRTQAAAERAPMATPTEVADHLGKSPKTLQNWRTLGIGPRWHKVGQDPRYYWTDVDAWVAERSSGGAA